MKVNNPVDSIVKGFIGYLQENQLLDLLPQISKKISQASWTKTDPNLAVVTSAIKLQPRQSDKIKAILSGEYKRPIRIKNRVDRSIIGGLHVNVAGKTIDNTIKSRLKQLKDQIAYG